MKLHKSIIGSLATLVVLSGVCGLSAPMSASAATSSDPSFTQLKDALELLRGNMLRLKDQMGSSTQPLSDRKMKKASSTKAFGEDVMGHGSSTRASSTKAIDRTCMQKAVDAREEAIMSAFRTFSSSTLSAMEKRQAAFTTVWTDTAIKNPSKYNGIWTNWKKASEAARKQLRKEQVAAWRTFHTTATQSCKAQLPKAESETQETGTTAI